MQIAAAIANFLLATPAVTDLVGDRVRKGTAYQDDQLPLVIYQEASQQFRRTVAGRRVNLNKFVMSIDCYAATSEQAEAIRSAIDAALEDYAGPVGDGAYTVTGVWHEDQDGDAELPADGTEQGEHRAGLELSIWFNRN